MSSQIHTGYKPRQHQVELHRAIKKHRFSIVVAHRRFGKTVCAVNHLIDAALRSKLERPRYAYIAPYRNQAKTIAWDYIKAFTSVLPGVSYNEAELRADLPNGARITLFGADNANSLRGQYFDGVFFDEYAQIAPSVFSEVIRPALSDRMGWCVFGGTPMGRNHFHALIELAKGREDWCVSIYKASETGVIAPSELSAALAEMGDDRYKQEFECSFDASVVGAYYAEQIKTAEEQKRITEVPLDGMLSVHTAWDLGMGDDTAIWCYQQSPGGQVRIIDYIENHGVGLDWYVREIKERASTNGWVLGEHLLPHDVEVRELGTGRSRFDTLVGLGIRPNICPKLGIDDGINAVRVLFPRLWFDTNENVQRGLDALRQYRREYDEKRQVFYEKPLHNWTSHACLDGDSVIDTARGRVAIRDVVVGDYVLTPAGYALVSAAGEVKKTADLLEITLSDGRVLVATPEHKIFTTRGVVCADTLRYDDVVINVGESPCCSYQKIKSVGYRDAFIESFAESDIGSGLVAGCTHRRQEENLDFFTAKSILQFMVSLLAGTRLRPQMGTLATQTLTTGLKLSRSEIERTASKKWTGFASISNQKATSSRIMLSMAVSQCTAMFGRSITARFQTDSTFITKTGTKAITTLRTWNSCLRLTMRHITALIIRGLEVSKTSISYCLSKTRLKRGIKALKGWNGTAKTVKKHGNADNGSPLLVSSAESSTKRRFQTGQSSVTTIARLRRLDCAESKPVYDLTVEHHHCYFANGVLVSNSDAMRYLAVGLREQQSSTSIRRNIKGII